MNQDTLDEVFCEGRNVEEALQAACDKLNTTPNQVEHEVVREGSNGGVLAFLKGRTTRIRVWKKSAGQVRLTETLRGLFKHLEFVSDFKVTQAEDAFEVAIDTEGADGLLIGRGGETLAALQHLIARMASRIDENMRVRVDVAGYRKRRQEQLRKMALEMAEKAHAGGREVLTEALPADERRIVHLALSEDGRVETHALGDGLTKRIAVAPVGELRGGTAQGESRGAERGRGTHGSGRGGRPARDEEGSGSRPSEGRASGQSRGHSGRGHAGPGAPPRERRSGGSDSPRGRERGRRGRGAGVAEPARASGRGHAADGPARPRERGEEGREPMPVRDRDGEARERMTARGPESAVPDPIRTPEQDGAGNRAGALKPVEDSYFKIPESIGLISSPSRQAEAGADADETGADEPRTFGRRPRAARGRRR